jgi:hypothetical protein
VDEHVHVGLGIVADRGAVGVGDRIPEVLREQLGVVQELLEMAADPASPEGTPLALMVARVSAKNCSSV